MGESAPREIVVETRDAEIVLSNQGARVVHWRLKNYMDPQGSMVDLVPSDLPATEATPFVLRVQDQAVTRRIQTALYRVTGDQQGKVDATTEARTVEFAYQDAGGLLVKKILRFEPSRNLVTLTADVRSGSSSLNPTVLWGPGLGDQGASAGGGSFFTGSAVQPPQAILHRAGKVERHAPDALLTQPGYEGDFRFVGINDHYFIATVVNGGQARSEFVPVTLPGAEGQAPRRLVSMALTFAKPPADVTFFVGPKQFDLLRSVDAELVRAIDFGMFAWLVVPLLGALKWLFGFVGNYGWSIIALTIGLNLAMFPLRHKSTVAMRKMQADPAADEGHPGPLRQPENHRSWPPEDERGDRGAVQEGRRQPGERLRPDAADASGAPGVLRPVVPVDRAARRPVRRMDPRSVVGGPVLRPARS